MTKLRRQFQPLGLRYCSVCKCTVSVKGGDWVISADKLKRRWHCGKHFKQETDEVGSIEAYNGGIIYNRSE